MKNCTHLTKREEQIIDLLLEGYLSYKQIAKILVIELSTLKSHFNNIFSKMQVHSKHELIGKIYIEKLQQLKQENEELKKQYNCYACGNCNGKENYINLEKHHIGLRKQYDKHSQCLDEIEKILQTICETTKVYPLRNNLLKILKKIKEVRGE